MTSKARGSARAKVFPADRCRWGFQIQRLTLDGVWTTIEDGPTYPTRARANLGARAALKRSAVRREHLEQPVQYVYPEPSPETGDTAAGLLRDLYVDTAQRCDYLETCACSEARAFRYLKEDLA